jgi:phage terminase small subunit
MEDLTPKEQLFVLEYLTNNFNCSKAAVSAGYSERSKYDIGHELLRKPKIKAYIDKCMQQESLEKLELLKRLSDIARNVGSEYITDNGDIDIAQLREDGYGHVIKKVRRLKNGRHNVEFHDSANALGQLAKIHKLISDNPTVTVNLQNEIDVRKQLDDKLKTLAAKLAETNYVMG